MATKDTEVKGVRCADVIISDPEYRAWVRDLGRRYMQNQVRAAVGLNAEQLKFYWSVGRDIVYMHVEERWGQGVIRQLSADLTNSLDRKGFSVTSLGYMKRFYLLYPEVHNILPPAEGELQNLPPAGGEITESIFCIPWGHHKLIMDKVEGDQKKARFFVLKSLENQWGRGMLENMLSSNLYQTQGMSVNNFALTLPEAEADLARDLIKGTYQFGFTQIREQYNEAQLKNQLVDHIRKFLLELGRGFSFVGQEYRIVAAGKEKYVDLLFYIIPFHRYCLIVPNWECPK